MLIMLPNMLPTPRTCSTEPSSGQHGAYVKQGSPNHRGGTACRRDLASGTIHGTSLEYPWNYPCGHEAGPTFG